MEVQLRVVASLAQARDVVLPLIGASAIETACVIHLSADFVMLGTTLYQDGLVDMIVLPLRAVIRDALGFDARAIVLAHNHPSGLVDPSRADKHVTRELARVGHALGIRLMDHIVVGPNGELASMRQRGLI